MKKNNDLTVNELMDILAEQTRKVKSLDINDRNFMKVVAQSKEVGNLAGKAINLAVYDGERKSKGDRSETLLTTHLAIEAPKTKKK